MSAPAVIDIDLGLCFARGDARPVDQGAVAKLVLSITELGLLQPVSVRRASRDGCDAFEVIAGLHRVEAFRRLARATIPAIVVDVDDLRAALILVDENLCRNDLSPAERSAAIAKRKSIYEALHPETRHGASGGGHEKSRVAESATLPDGRPAERFTKATAEITGRSERSVQVEARRGDELGEVALAKLARTSLDKGDELDALVKLSPERREQLIERAVAGQRVSARNEVKKEKRDNRERVLAAVQLALPQKRYGVIYADPEWQFEVYSRESGMDRAADNHYSTSPTDDICARPVADIAADDCVLFLWATAPMLPDALRVMSAWGFEYKSHQIWGKDRIGTGFWFRNLHELLLVGTKGSIPAPAMGTQADSLLHAPLGRHSAKPSAFHEMIERYFPNLPKIELNARAARPGWDVWGNEAPVQEASAAPEADSGGAAELPVASPVISAVATGPEPYRNDDDGLDIPAFLRRKRTDSAPAAIQGALP